jgi:hypothetical protein
MQGRDGPTPLAPACHGLFFSERLTRPEPGDVRHGAAAHVRHADGASAYAVGDHGYLERPFERYTLLNMDGDGLGPLGDPVRAPCIRDTRRPGSPTPGIPGTWMS